MDGGRWLPHKLSPVEHLGLSDHSIHHSSKAFEPSSLGISKINKLKIKNRKTYIKNQDLQALRNTGIVCPIKIIWYRSACATTVGNPNTVKYPGIWRYLDCQHQTPNTVKYRQILYGNWRYLGCQQWLPVYLYFDGICSNKPNGCSRTNGLWSPSFVAASCPSE